MTDTVLLTGISGFVGGHTALALLKAGYRVRGSLRSLEKADKVRGALQKAGADTASLEFVELNLMSDGNWAEAIKDCRYLAHIASPFVIEAPRDPDDLIRPAVEGTERALKAALSADVERIVLTSSMAAIMYGHPAGRSEPFTAADWTDPDQPDVTAYVKSKYLAERHAWQIMEEAGRRNDLAVINPSNVQGPLLDDDPGTSGALTIRLMDGGLPAVPQMSFPTIDVRDVAAAHVAALQNPGAGGHRFPMSAGTIAFIDAANALRRAFPEQARKIPRSVVPNVLVRFFAMFDRDLRDNVGELGRLKIVDSTLAMKLLGHDLIPPDDAFVAMGGSLIERGLV